MKEAKYCPECGCYISDLEMKCRACGFEIGNPFGNLHPAEIPVHMHESLESKPKINYRNLKS